MDAFQFKRVEELFTAAAALDSAARGPFLDTQCAGQPELRKQVESLLSHSDKPADYLKTPVPTADSPLRRHVRRMSAMSQAMPTRIGRYRVHSVLGEGGFGVVYLAEQDMPRRTVALKVLRPEIATPSVLRRFEFEAEILGQLQHPAIAQIFDAGTAETDAAGRSTVAYYAMEYVNGLPLTEYAARKLLGIPERLELLAKVCDGVHHAHQKGVIHRDLKPANILVIENAPAAPAGRPEPSEPPTHFDAQPKILDFGVARAAAVGQRTMAHTTAGQLVGTIPYMSPEQVGSVAGEIDTRSDVYALGVLLYQLLSGRLPYDLDKCPLPEAIRIIRDDAPRRLGTSNRVFRGEIDLIVSTALEKDKSRRYQSAADLAEDIRRYLRGEPIAAKADSALYVLRKQLRRHWLPTAAAAVFLVLISGFAVHQALQSRAFQRLAASETDAKARAIELSQKERQSRELAEFEQSRADATAARLEDELRISNIDRGRLFGKTDSLNPAEDLIWREHLANPAAYDTHWALWELYARHPWMAAFQAHDGNVTDLAFHPTRPMLITGGDDGLIQLWDSRSWENVGTLVGHGAGIVGVAISPDGRTAVSMARDARMLIWDLETVAPTHEIGGHRAAVGGLTFSPDGRWLVACCDDLAAARMFETTNWTCVSFLYTRSRTATRGRFSPDGRRLVIRTREGDAWLWSGPWDQPSEMGKLEAAPPGVLATVAFTPDSRRLVGTTGWNRGLPMWDAENCLLTSSTFSPYDRTGHIRFSTDGRDILTDGGWSIVRWDVESLSPRESILLPSSSNVFDVDARSQAVAYGDVEGFVHVREPKPMTAFTRLEGHTNRCAVVLNRAGTVAAVGDMTGNITLWDTEGGRRLAELKSSDLRVHSLQFDPTGRYLAAQSAPGQLKVWDLSDGQCVQSFPRHYAICGGAISWRDDGQEFLYVGDDRMVHFVETRTWSEVGRLPMDPAEPVAAAFSRDGNVIACVSRSNPIRVWTRDGTLLASLHNPQQLWSLEFSPDNRYLASGSWSKTVEIWDWRTQEKVASLEGHLATVWSISFHPLDSNLIASVTSDGLVRLFDIAERRSLLTLAELGESEALTVKFSGDGTRLAASNALGTAGIWRTDFYDLHIAGQIDYQIRRQAAAMKRPIAHDALQAWAGAVRARAADALDRSESASVGVSPGQIATWGRRERAVATGGR